MFSIMRTKTITSGVYKLEWANGYFYIGQASDFKKRWRSHRNGFKSGHMEKHQLKLYNVWLKHGEPTFHAFEPCLIMQLNDVEQRHITAHWGNPLLCNTSPSSRNCRGVKHSKPSWNKGIPMTEEMKQHISSVKKGMNAGTKHSMCKLTDKQVVEIRTKYIPFTYSTTMLAKEYGVTSAAIKRILDNKSWSHLSLANVAKNKKLASEYGAIEFNGESRNLRQWAAHLGLDYLTLYQRVKKYNWSLDKAFGDASHQQGQKLTEDQVREIRTRYTPHSKQDGSVQLGKEYNVSHNTILMIVKGDRYADVI